MANYTIFKNMKTNEFAAVYDFHIPTQTGIGRLEHWVAVHHGEASGLFDMVRQRKEYEERQRAGK